MKTFKTLAAIACLATAAFASVPAQAGMRVNGINFNGINFNGITVNGITINGTAATGIQAGTPVAVTLPEVAAR